MKHNLKLFEKSINNKFKLLPILIRKNDIGKTKYIPPFFKEWNNTGYFYYKNTIKKLPMINILINKLIKVYFNLFYKNLKKNKISVKRRNNFLNNIYISKAEVKYTNSISIITIYTMNNLNMVFKKYEEYLNYLIRKKESIQKSPNNVYWNKNKVIKKNLLVKQWPISIMKQYIRPNFLNYIGFKSFYILNNKNTDINFYSNSNKVKFQNFNDIIKYNFDFYNKKSELFYLEMIKLRLYDIKQEYFIYLETIWKYNQLNISNFMKLNNNSPFILKLKNILSRILNTKIELNIINIKYHSYHPDFITKFLSLKLKKNKFNIIKSMTSIINRSKMDISKYNKYKLLNNNNLIENKYKDLSLISIVNNKDFTTLLKEIYNFQEIYYYIIIIKYIILYLIILNINILVE